MKKGSIYQEIFDLFPSAIFIISKNASGELIFTDVNREGEKQFCVTRRQLIGAPLSSALDLLQSIPLVNVLLALSYDSPKGESNLLRLSGGAFAVCVPKSQPL